MVEKFIGLEVAKLAKQKGFDWETLYYHGTDNGNYCEEDKLKGYSGSAFPKHNWNEKPTKPELHIKDVELFSAPTQSLLQKWLREKHNIEVYVLPYSLNNSHKMIGGSGYYEVVVDKALTTWSDNKSYEEALEKGLYEGLKLI